MKLNELSKIAFIGAGNMASSIIGGLLQRGVAPTNICASDPSPEGRQGVRDAFKIGVEDNNLSCCRQAKVVVLAVKPQVLRTVCLEIKDALPEDCLIISIAAGINCQAMEKWLGRRPIVRAMPNTPALVGAGASAFFATEVVSAKQKHIAKALLDAVGLTLEVQDEKHIDAVTAVSGSGPAYFFLMLEAMTASGVKLGLPASTAEKLAVQTALGAAKLALESEVDVKELRRRVTSPKGTTEKAIQSFCDNHFFETVDSAMQACAARAAELADELGK